MLKNATKKDCQSMVKLSYSMSGKMENVLSLSTNCVNCGRCQKRHNIKGTICEHCYAFKQLEHPNYKNTSMIKNFDLNESFFTSKIRDYNGELKPIAKEIVSALAKNNEIIGTDEKPCNLFRLESFGDVHNITHAINYFLLCSAIGELAYIYHVNVAWWTKNFDYMLKAWDFVETNLQNNVRKVLHPIFSSTFVNFPISKKYVEKAEKKLNMKIKRFTVYTKEYAEEHNIIINCGSRDCFGCRNCYSDNGDDDINELQK